jgi:alpha-glucosidase
MSATSTYFVAHGRRGWLVDSVVALFFCLLTAANGAAVGPMIVKSPDGLVAVSVGLTPAGEPFWRVDYRGRPVLAESRLGLRLKSGDALDAELKVVSTATAAHDSTWKPVAGDRSEVRDYYQELVVDLQDAQSPPRQLRLAFRAYNEGAAVGYQLPTQVALKAFTITNEVTEFHFAADYPCWPVYSAQGIYTNKPLSQVRANCERPLVVEIKDGPVVAVGEAGLVDYARMRLKNAVGQPTTLVPDLGSAVDGTTPFRSPWRFVMVADTAGQLLERNYLVSNLNDPCALADTSWIKPGKVIRETSLSTSGGLACVDFAVKAGLHYIEFDAGWYGPESSDASDARLVSVSTNRPQGGLDLPQVIRYGNEHGVGVLLYVNRRALERQIDDLLPLYQQWGVKGIKFGFVNVGAQKWTALMHEWVRKCAQYHLVVDIHDEYRPTGWSRTYPNLLTQEGVRGNEEMPPAWHNVILPFTRFLCGPADYTICWNDKRVKNTHAHQMAASAVYFSPLQFLYWYDRPAQIQWAPELEYFKALPVTWDETRVLQGAIGQHLTVARRKGETWFVGTLNAVERRGLVLPLDFLKPGQKYTAWIYRDAQPDGSAPAQVTIQQETVDAQTVIRAEMAENGGHALRIMPLAGN